MYINKDSIDNITKVNLNVNLCKKISSSIFQTNKKANKFNNKNIFIFNSVFRIK